MPIDVNNNTTKQLKQLESAVNACPDIVYITDADGRINYVNSAFEKITGWVRNEVIGKNPSFMQSADNTNNPNKAIWECLARHETWTGRLKNQYKNKSNSKQYWVHATITPILEHDGSVSGYISIQRDISALVVKEMKMALETESDRIRTRVLETLQQRKPLQERLNRLLDILFILKDLEQQKKGAIFFHREDSDEFDLITARGNFSDLFLPNNNPILITDSRLGQAIKQGNISCTDQCCCDGPKNSKHGHYAIPLIHAGNTLGIILLFTKPQPIKDPVRNSFLTQLGTTVGLALADEYLRKELTKARNTAVDTVRIKSEFLSNISHEIRTPINGFQGMLALLNDTELDDEQKMLVSVARGAASDLLDVIDDVLDFSELDTAQMQIIAKDFCIHDLVQQAIQDHYEKAKQRDMSIVAEIGENVPEIVHADPLRIKQNLGNYIDNSIKFSETGPIVIRVEYLTESRGNFLKLSVTDEGIGIADENKSTLFQSFRQIDGSPRRKFGGIGLGLTIVSRLTEMMGGEYGLDSTLGEGSTFWFTVLLRDKTPSKTEPIDERTLDGLRDALGDDFPTVRNAFLNEVHNLVIRCEKALIAHDNETVAKILCGIKTSCKEIGAKEMLNIVDEIESAIADGQSNQYSSIFERLKCAYQKLIRYFDEEVA